MDEDTPPATLGQASLRLEAVPPPRRLVHTYERGEFTVVELRGEIDLSTIEEVGAGVSAATESPGALVVVDLRPAQFFDCAALTLLVRTHRLLLEHDGWMGLVCTHPWHLRILRLAGLTRNLRPVATVEAACARAPRGRPE
ncbi:STAS domain-containing protein [Streptomyces sp. RKAG337]|uniref:STAS domain-containing protein n=1 Tax=Streptomyces sp. RKAG337 TaxID=2893404 RepID=UPI002033CA8C|nr:STAS domain-containing protein [Streptomyces sp. RKAG337]MCM2430852.1 STAS domain-containing protein [Streptomyces sp. RKAG337]